MRAADALCQALKAEGVEHVFGIPGGAILPAYDPLMDSRIRHILVRHEQGAGHAAQGYAAATGKVCTMSPIADRRTSRSRSPPPTPTANAEPESPRGAWGIVGLEETGTIAGPHASRYAATAASSVTSSPIPTPTALRP